MKISPTNKNLDRHFFCCMERQNGCAYFAWVENVDDINSFPMNMESLLEKLNEIESEMGQFVDRIESEVALSTMGSREPKLKTPMAGIETIVDMMSEMEKKNKG